MDDSKIMILSHSTSILFNEVISTPLVFFNKDLSFLEKTKLLFLMLLVNPLVYKLLETFDYTNSVPKIVMYLDNQEWTKRKYVSNFNNT